MKGLIFTYVTAYGGALLSLFDPYIGLLVYVCFALIKPEEMWFWAVPQGNYSRVVALGLLVGWALQGFGRWNFGRARVVVTMMVCYWLWGVVGMLICPDPGRAWVFVEGVFKIILPVLVGVTMIDSMAKLKQLAWVILLSQGYLAFELNLSYYAGTHRVDNYAGLDNNSMAISMVTTVGLAFFLGLHASKWWQKGLAFVAAALMT